MSAASIEVLHTQTKPCAVAPQPRVLISASVQTESTKQINYGGRKRHLSSHIFVCPCSSRSHINKRSVYVPQHTRRRCRDGCQKVRNSVIELLSPMASSSLLWCPGFRYAFGQDRAKQRGVLVTYWRVGLAPTSPAEPVTGIDPAYPVWKTGARPLSYTGNVG